MKEKISIWKMKIYCFVVNQNPYVRAAYQLPVDLEKEYHQKHRVLEWFRLIGLLIKYRVLNRKPSAEQQAEWEKMRKEIYQREMAALKAKADSDDVFINRDNDARKLRWIVDEAVNELKEADLIRFSHRRNIIIWGDDMERRIFSLIENIVSMPDSFRDEYRFIWLKNGQMKSEIQTFPTFYFPWSFLKQNSYLVTENLVLTDDELRTLARYHFLQKAVGLIWKKCPGIKYEYAQLMTHEIYRYFSAVLEYMNPRMILVRNDSAEISYIFRSVCNEIEVPFVNISSDCFNRAYGFDAVSSPKNNMLVRYPGWVSWVGQPTPEELCDVHRKIEELRTEKPIGRRKIKCLSKIDFSRPLIFMCGQDDVDEEIVPYDSEAQKYRSPNFESIDDALFFMAEICRTNRWNLLYKPDMALNREKESEKILPSNIIDISEYDMNFFIDMCDVFVVLNSELSYAALIHKKPVVLLGYSSVSGQGCCYEAYNRTGIDDVIDRAVKEGMTDCQYEQFLKYIVCLKKYYYYSTDADSTYGQSIDKSIEYLKTVLCGTVSF